MNKARRIVRIATRPAAFLLRILLLLAGAALGVGTLYTGPVGAQETETKPPAVSGAKPLSDADALQVRNLQLRATGARLAIAESSQRFQDAQRELETASGEIQKLFADLQRRYHCLDCDLDRNLAWQPKAQTQAQTQAQGPTASPVVPSPKPESTTTTSTNPNPQVEKTKK
jgi:hypothetical protein